VADVAPVLGMSAPALPERAFAAVVASSDRRAAILCNALLGHEEVVVKSLGDLLSGAPGYLGAAILGDGRIALVLDPALVVGEVWRRAGPPRRRRSRQAPHKVLVVDDEATVRELQKRILETADYRVLAVADGARALEALDSDPEIELVVTDLQMPTMDGFELLQAIRGHPERASLPVVILSSQRGEAERRRGFECGAEAYIVKDDFQPSILLATLSRLFRQGPGPTRSFARDTPPA
jgi:two-component system chemotaxis sensor kinase CheA